MRRMILGLLLALFVISAAQAQSTTVTSTVTDTGGVVWVGGNYTFTFVGSQTVNWPGGAFNRVVSGTLDGTGSFSVSLPSTSTMTGGPASWTLQVTPITGISQGGITITAIATGGGTQPLTVTPNAIHIVGTSPLPVAAYADAEIVAPVQRGMIYYQVTSATAGTYRQCQGLTGNACTTWGNVASSGGGITSITTTGPITGGPITTTGAIACPTCVVASAPGAGIAHFAGATQTVTSSAVNLAADVSGQLPIGAVGSVGLSGTAPIAISAAGVISCSTCGTSSITLETNGTSNGSQSLLNQVAGTNISITDDGIGDVTTAVTGLVPAPQTVTVGSSPTRYFDGYDQPTGVVNTDAISAGDLGQVYAGTATGLVNVLAINLTRVTAYTAGIFFFFTPNLANTTTTPTVNVNALGAITLTRYGGQALVANDLITTQAAFVFMPDATHMNLMNPQTGNVPFSLVSAANVTASNGNGTFKALLCGTAGSASCVITLTGTTSGTTTITGPAVAGTTTNAVAFSNAISTPFYQTATNCAAVGTAASPSVASCTAAPAGQFSCATNATGATCQVNTTAVTANSEIFVLEADSATTGTRLGVTCNTGTTVNPATRLIASQTAATGFTINLGTVTTNPACFSYHIIN